MTARSGRAALKYRLEKLGFKVDKKQVSEIYPKFLLLADKKKMVNDADLQLMMGMTGTQNRIGLEFMEVICGSSVVPSATIKLKYKNQIVMATENGDGPIDSSFKAINKIIGKKIILSEYLVQAMTGGSDDMGKVHIQVSFKGQVAYGFGADTDIVVASVKSYIDAINKLI